LIKPLKYIKNFIKIYVVQRKLGRIADYETSTTTGHNPMPNTSLLNAFEDTLHHIGDTCGFL